MALEELSRIENQVMIRAPRSRVWTALTTPSEFSAWFHATVNVDVFSPGKQVDLVSTYPGHAGVAFSLEVLEKVPEQRFVWRWYPAGKVADSPAADDPSTTVVFELSDVEGGTLVKVTESGFDRISLVRRAQAFESNTKGWQIQMQNIHDYVEQNG